MQTYGSASVAVGGPRATVRVPATSANLGPGFDSLGLALDLCDEVTAEATSGTAVMVEVQGEGEGTVALDERHLVAATMLRTFKHLGLSAPGLKVKCRNRIPHARGLGSSSAAIVAGIMLADALAGAGLTRAQKLVLASEIEGHPDNVAPCLLGGFTIAYTTEDGAKAISLDPSPRVHPWAFVPQSKGLTSVARAALPEKVPHADAVFNLSRSALLAAAITHHPSRLFEATDDRLHQSYRAKGMPESTHLLRALRSAGIASAISGAGPTVLALTIDDTRVPEVPSGFEAMRLEVADGAVQVATSPNE
ncbi:homoserine kinase [Glycomyces algeriensis]|uniref:Homoserine kinase n=1 Tax=Glycomyces algeriensis TaxID=256037 RepID=A0A9W6GBD4_9ACTN|nr:homoserine kinase [Glycomyces algeriensis]MDA1366521.1 homoserine kinase [Glycomyces algeriensis]MDR7352179.1 homoserine kinase [Glycomyces algeriensis]GLI44914.1 homoserine kinase [Glycomyces algeriensis]